MTNDKRLSLSGSRYPSSLGIRHSFVIRHWAFVICVQCPELDCKTVANRSSTGSQTSWDALVPGLEPSILLAPNIPARLCPSRGTCTEAEPRIASVRGLRSVVWFGALAPPTGDLRPRLSS